MSACLSTHVSMDLRVLPPLGCGAELVAAMDMGAPMPVSVSALSSRGGVTRSRMAELQGNDF